MDSVKKAVDLVRLQTRELEKSIQQAEKEHEASRDESRIRELQKRIKD